ncbi:HAD family hydrolase [Rhizobium mayense]|uniref:HAD-IA family hydrolase n=1 Tax=Rhizobium mayense TaxID=1312184 RepID=A0ABT7JYV6_9HYPH|nr:HAD-IA family hydrolase [Rhizobium mayense]MDL2400099.1 HAD-IA family hydrolase [Rhizobium mayense]
MKVLMVDVDGVLVHGRPQDGLHFSTFLEPDLGFSPELLQKEFFKPYWSEIIVGREPMMPRLESVLCRIAPDISVEVLAAYWFKNDSRLDRAFLDALAHYRADGIRILLATNQEHMRAKYLMEELGLRAHVDGIFYSAALGHRKPSEAFYALASERAEASPSDIVFIDDVEENIDSARRFGWQAIHWTGEMALHDALAPFVAHK